MNLKQILIYLLIRKIIHVNQLVPIKLFNLIFSGSANASDRLENADRHCAVSASKRAHPEKYRRTVVWGWRSMAKKERR